MWCVLIFKCNLECCGVGVVRSAVIFIVMVSFSGLRSPQASYGAFKTPRGRFTPVHCLVKVTFAVRSRFDGLLGVTLFCISNPKFLTRWTWIVLFCERNSTLRSFNGWQHKLSCCCFSRISAFAVTRSVGVTMFVHSESKYSHPRLWFVYYREILQLHHWFISPFVISRKRRLKALKMSKWCRRGLQVCCERVKMLNGTTPALPVCEHGLRLWYAKHRFHEIKSLNNPGHLFNHYNITFAQDYTSWAENPSLSISNCCIFVYSFMSSKDLHW